MADISGLLKKAEEFSCKVCENESLDKHTSFKVGGKCKAFIDINDAKSCRELVLYCKENNIDFIVMGKGSNLIVDDRGYNGAVLHFGSDYSGIELLENDTVFCKSGTSLSALCLFALENSLSGLEFAWGIPGSVGGAVYMNAGAYGGEISDVIISAEYIDLNGEIHAIVKEDMDFSYRHSCFSGGKGIILGASFKLQKGKKEEIRAKMDELMQRRRDKQPLEYPSAGSTFKRPNGSYASLLIEQCGLKGLSVGGAKVSEKHSGFVINTGKASFNDIMELIEKVRKIVKEKTGYELECEPEIIRYRD